jgi:hypothetical protein
MHKGHTHGLSPLHATRNKRRDEEREDLAPKNGGASKELYSNISLGGCFVEVRLCTAVIPGNIFVFHYPVS